MAGRQNSKQTTNQRREADFGYFGKGIDGYVHYMLAFNRNFPKDTKADTQPIVSQSTSFYIPVQTNSSYSPAQKSDAPAKQEKDEDADIENFFAFLQLIPMLLLVYGGISLVALVVPWLVMGFLNLF